MHPRTVAVLALAFGPFLFGSVAHAQDSSIYVQCPSTTDLHPGGGDAVKCAHFTSGDGMITMADGNPLYTFGFATLPSGGPADNSPEFPGWVMAEGTLAAMAPGPTLALDEGDEMFLNLTNVGMTMRPDLADPHSVHWHGFPQAASVFDGVPDASITINMGATLTYYYLANEPGTYFYHCHVEATEHMQMGMNGNIWVRPAQNKLPGGTLLPLNGFVHQTGNTYVYNDGDGSTRYDVEYPIQIAGMDRQFHELHLAVQPLPFKDMRDTYWLINGRGYPDTIDPNPMSTLDPLGNPHESQPVSSLIEATQGQRILLRISNVNVTVFNTIASTLPMLVVGKDAKLLRDDDDNNLYYETTSIDFGGGQTYDVIIDTANVPTGTYFVYSTNLQYLSNDAENFGGMMTEIRIN